MTGIVGTGKSTAAEAVAESVGVVVVSSDRVRKWLAGMDPMDAAPADIDEALYSEAWTRRTDEGLLERAAAIIASERVAVLDATLSRGEQRSAAEDFARASSGRDLRASAAIRRFHIFHALPSAAAAAVPDPFGRRPMAWEVHSREVH